MIILIIRWLSAAIFFVSVSVCLWAVMAWSFHFLSVSYLSAFAVSAALTVASACLLEITSRE